MIRTVESLSPRDVGKAVRVEHNGTTHVGTLESVRHRSPVTRETNEMRVAAWISVRYANGKGWFDTLDGEATVEVDEEK